MVAKLLVSTLHQETVIVAFLSRHRLSALFMAEIFKKKSPQLEEILFKKMPDKARPPLRH
jgi:hypothetical protein